MKKEKRQEIHLQTLQGYVPYRQKVLIKPRSKDGQTSKGGLIVGFNPDAKYVDEQGSHIADMTATDGIVVALPLHHYTADYTTQPEVMVGDRVWFSYRGSLHGIDVWVGKELYRLINYDMLTAAERNGEIIILNGYVLLEEVIEGPTSDIVYAGEQKANPTKGIVRFMGTKREYPSHYPYTDDIDLEIGDEVLIRKSCPDVKIERQPYLATFPAGDKPLRRVKRADIIANISSFHTE